MTKEELKEKAEEWIKDYSGLIASYKFVDYGYGDMQDAFLAGYETGKDEAKELLREFVKWANWQGNSKCPSFKNIQDKAEAFLKKETEQTCSNCKHYAKNYELCCYSLGDEDYDCRGRKWEKVED